MTDQEKFDRYMLPANIVATIVLVLAVPVLATAVVNAIENAAYLAVNPENPLEAVQ